MIAQRTPAKLMPSTGVNRCYNPIRPKLFPDCADLEGEGAQDVWECCKKVEEIALRKAET